jgi:predicted Rossmann-fold nucleotide-binding protein
MVVQVETGPVVAIFASDRGPGDPERASLMGEVGRVFSRKGARILCLAEGGVIPVPLITAARTAKGQVEILADTGIVLPPALAGVPITVLPDHGERMAYLAQKASVLVGLPGSLVSATALFQTWARGAKLPVVMLNRHGAFDVIRGFAADVLAPALPGHDRHVQFAETAEDLWNKVVWVGEQRR